MSSAAAKPSVTRTTAPSSSLIHGGTFRTPTITYHGFSALNQLGAELNLSVKSNKRVMIICDVNVRSLGYIKNIEDLLDPSMQTDICSDITAEPTEEVIQQLVHRMHNFSPDVLIAMGGGSVIDVAKVCSLIYNTNPQHDRSLEPLYSSESTLMVTKSLGGGNGINHFICIPTTSGSGSESTPFAFVRDPKTHEPKRMIVSLDMLPDITIVDAFFTSQLPKDVVVQTGFDVLVKAIESLASPESNDATQSLSTQAARIVFKHLYKSATTGRSEHRGAMHDAAAIVGMAVANTLFGAAHAIGSALQSAFLRHGKNFRQAMTNSIALVEVMKFNAHDERALHLYAELSIALGFSDNSMTKRECFDQLVDRIKQLKQSLALPLTIQSAGMSKVEFESELNEIITSAMTIIQNFTKDARPLTKKDVESILRASF